jgi:peptide/nickel transport system ATP-binding protein
MLLTQEVELRTERGGLSDGLLLSVKRLRISFVTRSGLIQAINDVSFDIRLGETFGLVGETGCGKSQTAMAIMRLTPEAGVIERGEIFFNGKNLAANIGSEFKLIKKNEHLKLKRNKSQLKQMTAEMSRIRGREISMIFQEPMTSLNPVYTVGRQISEVMLTHSVEGLVDRILARNSANGEKLRQIANSAIRQKFSRSELQETLRASKLEGLGDQIWFILNRGDIGVAQKIQIITSLSNQKVKPITLRFLHRVKNSRGKIPFEYRILNKIPFVKRWFIGALNKEALTVSYELLSLVNMPNAESVLHQYPHELSGGMRQRAMIAMAIAGKPKLIIADEPTSALDVTVQAQILDLLRDLKKTFNTSVLFISHDMGVIAEICDRVAVMYAGNIVEVAEIDELFRNPKHPYTQGLLAAIPKYGEKRETLQAIKGTVPNLVNPPKGCRFNTRCPYVFEKCTEGPPWIEFGKGHGALCWLYGDSDTHVNQ